MVSYHTADSKSVKQEAKGTVILLPLVFLGYCYVALGIIYYTFCSAGHRCLAKAKGLNLIGLQLHP